MACCTLLLLLRDMSSLRSSRRIPHPLRCLASQLNVHRWRAMLRCHTPSPALAPHWHVTGIHVGQQQRRAVLCGGALLRVLVRRLLYVRGEYGVIYPLNLARRIASRRHFLGSK